jgi:hypothetical protein
MANELIEFSRLENLQNVESTVVKIFSKYRDIDILKPEAGKNPTLAIIVGAPGVGKTTKSKEILSKMKYNYNNFFNISLDAIVEKILPYREKTQNSYYKLLNKKAELLSNVNTISNEDKYGFSDFNAAILADYYLPTVSSTNSNFSLNKTEKNISEKIKRYRDAGLLKEYKNEKNAAAKARAAEKAKATRKKKKNNAAGAVEESVAAPAIKNLLALRLEALDYGVKNGLNILYDTTLRPKTNIIDRDIMPVLEKYKDTVKYKIIVVLVTAPQKNIEERIRRRHQGMLEEENPYIRAINPMLTKMFIEQNKEGFEEAKEYFKDTDKYEKKHPDTIYTKNSFIFVEKSNPSIDNVKRNLTRKNKYYNKALRDVRTLFPNNNF